MFASFPRPRTYDTVRLLGKGTPALSNKFPVRCRRFLINFRTKIKRRVKWGSISVWIWNVSGVYMSFVIFTLIGSLLSHFVILLSFKFFFLCACSVPSSHIEKKFLLLKHEFCKKKLNSTVRGVWIRYWSSLILVFRAQNTSVWCHSGTYPLSGANPYLLIASKLCHVYNLSSYN